MSSSIWRRPWHGTDIRRARLAEIELALALAGCSAGVQVGDDTQPQEPTSNEASAYCEETGGMVETRNPYWNTNGDQSTWVQLPGEMDLCWYQTTGDESRIYLDLVTLYSETPTLAAAAYLARAPLGRTGVSLTRTERFGGSI